jgi:DNA-binding transcriptional ArsR family regulator
MLYNYNMNDNEDSDSVFKALASPTRRAILDFLKNEPQTTGSLADRFPDLDRCTVMQHLGVLTDAGLVIAQRKGRERWNHFNPLPIRDIQQRWIGPLAERPVEVLARLKDDLEG